MQMKISLPGRSMNPLTSAFACCTLLALSSCTPPEDEQPAPTPQVEISWPEENWERSTLSAEGLSAEPINAFIEEMRNGTYGLVDRFVLIRNGRLIIDERFEQDYAAISESIEPDQKIGLNTRNPQYDYDNPDWHPYYLETDLHSLQSVTKSITSAALGTVIDAGLIDDTGVPVLSLFADYEFDRSDARRADITLDDLLTMRSGIDWATDGGYDAETHSTVALENSEEWIQYVLDRPMDADPGTVFEYNDGVSVLLGKVLRAATGQRIDDWAATRLFEPIGISDFYWKITPDGEADTEGGLYLSAYDLARIGHLFLHEGQWRDQQVLSEEWVEKSVKLHVPDARSEGLGYGYQWWIPHDKDGQTNVFEANGFGGQRLIVFRDLEMVAVFNGWDIRGDYTSAATVFRNEIVPIALQ